MRHLGLLLVLVPAAAHAQLVDGPPGYAQPIPSSPPPDRFALHHGVTFEANLGLGWVNVGEAGMSSNTDGAPAAAIGVGEWLSPHLALTFRISGVEFRSSGSSAVSAFIGPSLQYWIDPHFWIGGGAGLATVPMLGCSHNDDASDACGQAGLGLDLRAGYSFGDTANTFSVSAELTPAFYTNETPYGSLSITAAGVVLLFGYQYP